MQGAAVHLGASGQQPQRPHQQEDGEDGHEDEGGGERVLGQVFHGVAPFLGMRKHLGRLPK